jgi:hypothetical protein
MNRVDWAQSYMPNYSTGGAMQQALLASQYQPFNTFGGAEDQAWFLGGSQGERPSSRGGGGNYDPWAQMSQSPMPSGQFGGENTNTYGVNLPRGYLGMESIYQDPFSGYVQNQPIADTGGMNFLYLPRYDAQQGFQGG